MSEVFRSTVSSKGQVIIPAEVRRRYGFEEGTEVIFTEDNGRLILEPLNFHAIYQLQGILKRQPSALQLLEQERQEEREREDRPR
jgi:AbrB family looped-hinge helix DNA binding protein